MKTLFISFSKDFPVETAGNNVIIKHDLENDIIYELGSELIYMVKSNILSDKTQIITDYKIERPQEFNLLDTQVIQKIKSSLLLDTLPQTVEVRYPNEYVDWLIYHSNPIYSLIGKELKKFNNKFTLSTEELYDEYIKGIILKHVSEKLFQDKEIQKFTIVDFDNSNSLIVKDILNTNTSLSFESYSGSWIQCELGYIYYSGNGTEKNISEAIIHYTNAYEKGNEVATNFLGWCYQTGTGVDVDLKNAVKLYKRGIELGNPNSIANLGYCYDLGLGVNQDTFKAVEYYERASEKGISFAQQNLANIYYEGRLGEPNYEKAFKWYKKNAEVETQHFSQYRTGIMLLKGQGIKQNKEEAYWYFAKASNENIEDSCFQAGQLLEQGYGSVFDKEEAILNYYKKGAESNEPKSATALAIYYKKKNESLEKIIPLLNLGIEKKDKVALFETATLLLNNSSLKKNFKGFTINKLLDLSIEQGYGPAIKLKEDIDIRKKELKLKKEEEKRRKKEEEERKEKEALERKKRIEEERKRSEEELRKKKEEESKQRIIYEEKILQEFRLFSQTDEAVNLIKKENRNKNDINKAIELLIEPARKGFPFAKAVLGLILLLINSENVKAFKLIESSVTTEDTSNIFRDFFNQKNGDLKRNHEIIVRRGEYTFKKWISKEYKSLCLDNWMFYMYECFGINGYCHLNGLGVKKSSEKALKSLKREFYREISPGEIRKEVGWVVSVGYGFAYYAVGKYLLSINDNEEAKNYLKRAKAQDIKDSVIRIPKVDYRKVYFDEVGPTLDRPTNYVEEETQNEKINKEKELSSQVNTKGTKKKIPNNCKINEIKPSPSVHYKIEETNSEKVKKFFGKIFGKK